MKLLMEMVFQCSSSSASNDHFDDEPLLKHVCVLPCMPQNAPECASGHLKLSNLPGGACPTVNDYIGAMFSTLANDIAPTDGKSYVWPWTLARS